MQLLRPQLQLSTNELRILGACQLVRPPEAERAARALNSIDPAEVRACVPRRPLLAACPRRA